MDRFESMRAFVNVVDHNGFAAAARETGLPRSAVNKAVIKPENDQGAELLVRSARKVTATETGLAFDERCPQLPGDPDDAITSVKALQSGALRTTLVDHPPTDLVLSALYPRHRHLSAKVRRFVELLDRRFGGRPYRDLVTWLASWTGTVATWRHLPLTSGIST